MNTSSFQQGDIIAIDLDPVKGHEQSGSRPAVVISNQDYQNIMGLAIVCPITNKIKSFPSHVLLDARTRTTGAILCEHVRSIDLKARNARRIESLPEDIMVEALAIIHSCL